MPDDITPPGERSAMSEETRTMQTIDTTPARAPEDAPALVKKIGKTTYKVRVHFSNTSTECSKTRYSRCETAIYVFRIRQQKNLLDESDFI